MLQSCSYTNPYTHTSTELRHQTLRRRTFSIRKLSAPAAATTTHNSSFQARLSLGFNAKNDNYSLDDNTSNTDFNIRRKDITFHFNKQSNRNARVYQGFKIYCLSRTANLPKKSSSSVNGGNKRNSGVLPSVLRALESAEDFEKTLNSVCQNLSPKEQTVLLKRQRNWEKVVKVFEFLKSQKDYVPNVIHYNIVLRTLGRAQKWDELRLCWIEMAKKGVVPTNNTYGMLVDVYGKAGLVTEALLWIKYMRSRGIFPDEVTMNTVVRVLRDAREFDRASKFYQDWCAGNIELDILELDSATEFENGSSTPISFKHFLLTELFKTGSRIPSPKMVGSSNGDMVRKPQLTSTYNTLIDLYGKAGRLKDAANVFWEMVKSGVAMDTITFNTMIFTCGSHGHLSEAETLLNKMEEKGICPDTKTYNILLSVYADMGDIDAAIKCYQKIREVGLYPDVVSHRTILHILCERNMVTEVEAVLEEMEKISQHIDQHSLPGIIKMYINGGLYDKAEHILDKFYFDGGGLSPKLRAAVIDAYAEKGLWDAAEALFYIKRDSVGPKDVLEYNVMIKAYGMGKNYDKAFSLFKGMRNRGTWPDDCTYNSLIQMFSGGDFIDHARNLLTEMQGSGFKPQCLTFSSVIACCARLGRLSDAVSVFEEMIKVGVKPNEVVFGSLINGFAEMGNVGEALKYFSIMEKLGIPANQIILTSLIKVYNKLGCFDGAKELYQKMKNLEGGPDIVASNSMISLYAELGMVSEAEMIFNELRHKGCADGVSFATMMYVYKNMGMLDEAINVAKEMKLSGLLKDCLSYNKVLACYVANGQLHECGELLNEMIAQKLLPDAGTFKVLFTVLKKAGMATEAVTQLQSSYEEGKAYARQVIITAVFSALGMRALALESCETFMNAEIALDSFAYNVAIYAYGSSGNTDKALNTFMKMQDQGLKPDIVTYINLVLCYGKAGMVEGVKRIYSKFKYGEIEPSESFVNTVVDVYRNVNRHDLAETVKQEMRLDFGSQLHSDSDVEQFSDFENEDASEVL